MPSFIERRRRVLQRLPPLEEVLRGSVLERSIRCGKPGCRCATDDGHPATYLSVTHPGGRTEQISLPAWLVPQAKRWVANYLSWCEAVEKISEINRQLLRDRRASGSGVKKSAGTKPGRRPHKR